MLEIGQLSSWNVALIGRGSGDGESHQFGDIKINSFPTRKLDRPVAEGDSKFSIGVLTGPRDESIDLNIDQWTRALEITRAAWKPDAARGRSKEDLPSDPSGKGVREARKVLGGDAERGLLLLYPLSPYAYDGEMKISPPIVPGWTKPIMAFAIAFPASDKTISVAYDVNLLYWKQEYGPTE
jgi:hypothetical protein